MFAWKVDNDGNIVKPKARLVARGFSQVHTVGYSETYALTPAASSVKLLVAIAVKNDWELRQLDVKQAFIQADLDFNVFMKLPDGCGDKSGKVVKLNKSVYGLKQAGRRWAIHLGGVIVRKIGMEQCKADPCVFRLIKDGVVVMTVCVHVDDITVAEEPEACNFLCTCLLEKFQTFVFFFNLTYSRWTSSLPFCLWSQRIFPSLPCSRLTFFYRDASSALLQLVNQWLTGGELSWYLGCAFERDRKGGVVRASRRAFIESVVSRYGADAVSTSALGGTTSRSVINRFVRLLVV